MSNEYKGSDKDYSDSGFWEKFSGYAKLAGKEVIEKALFLYYAAQKESTPVWAKTTVYAALAYFISPIDAIPDITPVVGYVDDLGVLAAAVAAISTYIDLDVKKDARNKMEDWFGSVNKWFLFIKRKICMTFLPEIIDASLDKVLDVVKELNVPTVAILTIGAIAIAALKNGSLEVIEKISNISEWFLCHDNFLSENILILLVF